MRGSETDGEDSNRAVSHCICSGVSLGGLEVAAGETGPLGVEENPGAALFVTVAAAVA